jgi:hypothetical protein
MKKHLPLVASLIIACTSIVSNNAIAAGSSVVYHIDDAEAQGVKGLRNVRNHMDVAPNTKIIVVTHANGVDLMM